ncbi:hypothetical protein BaRGS_00037459, partial [Batillaria attramentaria]
MLTAQRESQLERVRFRMLRTFTRRRTPQSEDITCLCSTACPDEYGTLTCRQWLKQSREHLSANLCQSPAVSGIDDEVSCECRLRS